jgi:hypothetical protein
METVMTDDQKQELEKLWRIYGHGGPKWTIGNHKLIQRLIHVPEAGLEESIERYNAMMDNDPDKAITDECVTELKNLLG